MSAGNAAATAADALLTTLIDAAAAQWGCAAEQVQHRNGGFIGPKEEIFTLAELAAVAGGGESLTVKGTFEPPEARTTTAYITQAAEVEVDPESGEVTILRIISSHDVGLILNPLGHQGQINGGVIQGIGFAMTEDSPLIDGHISTLSMGDFKLVNIGDIPKLETILIEDDAGPVPFNGKAIGELPNVPIAAAIANAVEDAVGVRIADLPITAEKVFAALQAKGQ